MLPPAVVPPPPRLCYPTVAVSIPRGCALPRACPRPPSPCSLPVTVLPLRGCAPPPAAVLLPRGRGPPPAAVSGTILPLFFGSTMEEITPVVPAPRFDVGDTYVPTARAVDGARAAPTSDASSGTPPLLRLAHIFGGREGKAMGGRSVGTRTTPPVEAAAVAPTSVPTATAEANTVAATDGKAAEGVWRRLRAPKSRAEGAIRTSFGFFLKKGTKICPRARAPSRSSPLSADGRERWTCQATGE